MLRKQCHSYFQLNLIKTLCQLLISTIHVNYKTDIEVDINIRAVDPHVLVITTKLLPQCERVSKVLLVLIVLKLSFSYEFKVLGHVTAWVNVNSLICPLTRTLLLLLIISRHNININKQVKKKVSFLDVSVPR